MEYNYKCGCRGRGLCAKGSNTGNYGQLNTFNYLADIPENQESRRVGRCVPKLLSMITC